MKIQKDEEEIYINFIKSDLENKIATIMSIHHYNLIDSFEKIKNLNKENKNKICELLINDYIDKIKNLNFSKLSNKDLHFEIDDIISYFEYIEDKKDNHHFSPAEDKAEEIVDNIISSILNKNSNKVLPITIQSIEKYCILNSSYKIDTEKVVMWIILKLTVIYNYIKD